MQLYTKENRFIEYGVYPSKAVNADAEVVWSVSDETLANVDATTGHLSALAPGVVTVRVHLKEDPSIFAEMELVIEEESINPEYVLMRDRWLERIVGGEDLDFEDQDIKDYVATISNETRELIETMYRESDRTILWDGPVDETEAAGYTTHFNKIKTMALAFGIKVSAYYQDEALYHDIMDAIDFMITVRKYNGTFTKGNWWDWQIGSAQPYVDILFILDSYVDLDTMLTLVKPIEGYAKRPSDQLSGSSTITSTGANRTDIAISVLGSAILARSDERMNLVKDEVPVVFKIVRSGDGIYADGSLIQHSTHAYTGSYGNELVKGVGRIQSITVDTQWAFEAEALDSVIKLVDTGYIPLMVDGKMMSMVNGRSISRAPGTNPFTTEFEAGSETISNVMLIAQFAPEAYRIKFESVIKQWLNVSKEEYGFYAKARDMEAIVVGKRIERDESILPFTKENQVKIYGSMARAVQVKQNYTFGISMYSDKVSNYEFGNTENAHGWHTGSGVTYLYNQDYSQFEEGYWPTVDPYHLPGTTVDVKPLSDGAANTKRSSEKWMGGTAIGDIGTAGFYYNSSSLGLQMDAKAKKSWFMLDDAVVALGSGISGTSTHGIDTTVDNRMLNEDGSNEVSVNGTQAIDFTKKILTLEANEWVHLSGNGEGNDVVYLFPNGVELNIGKEVREGRYDEINKYFANDIDYRKNYLKMVIEHGKDVNDEAYEYVILPGKTLEDMQAYDYSKAYKVLANNGDVHAVSDATNHVFAMNVWNANGIALNNFKVDKAASLTTQRVGDRLTIAVSDPQQVNAKIKLSYELPYHEVISKDDSITLEADGSFTVNTNGAMRTTHTLVLRIDVDKSILQANVDSLATLVEVFYTPASWAEMNALAEEALLVLNDVNASQEAVDKMVSLVEAMKENLVLRADKTELDALIVELEARNETHYRPSTWTVLSDALSDARIVLADLNASQSDADAQVSALKLADAQLEFKAVLNDLNALILELETMNHDALTPFSQRALQELIDSAQVLISDLDVTQDDVDGFVLDAKDAIADFDYKLNFTEVEKSLEAFKTLVKEDYTEASWLVLEQAIADLQSLVDSYDPEVALVLTQAELDAAVQAVMDAQIALVYDLDITGLEDAIRNGKSYKKADYTDASFKKLEDALVSGESLLALINKRSVFARAITVTPVMVKDAIAEIHNAISGLVVVDDQGGVVIEPGEKPNVEKPDVDTGMPSTGVPSQWIWSLGFIGLGLVALVLNRRKKERSL